MDLVWLGELLYPMQVRPPQLEPVPADHVEPGRQRPLQCRQKPDGPKEKLGSGLIMAGNLKLKRKRRWCGCKSRMLTCLILCICILNLVSK